VPRLRIRNVCGLMIALLVPPACSGEDATGGQSAPSGPQTKNDHDGGGHAASSGGSTSAGSGGNAPLASRGGSHAAPTGGTGTDPSGVFRATTGGCGDAGWSSLTIAWNDLGYGDVQDGGFTACAPAGFGLEAVNSTFRWTTSDAGGWATTMLGGDLGTDHAYALQRVRDSHTAYCGLPGYAMRLLPIGGWPAIELRVEEAAPVCGACPAPMQPQPPLTRIVTTVAIDRFAVFVDGRAAAGASSDAVEGLFAIGQSISANHEPPDAALVQRELAMLKSDLASCP
jgi:hypothetical protein